MVIETQGLTRDYGSLRALDRLTITVPHGAVFGFLGPNGAGKTTTLRLLLGILQPTAGGGKVLGFDIVREGTRVRRQCGVLLEHPGLYERLTVLENLEFHRRAHHLDAREGKARIDNLLDRFQLGDWRERDAGALSRGMKQKLAVARAMLSRP